MGRRACEGAEGPINRWGGSRCCLPAPLTFRLLGGENGDGDVGRALWLVRAVQCQLEQVGAFLESPQLHLVRIFPLFVRVAIRLGPLIPLGSSGPSQPPPPPANRGTCYQMYPQHLSTLAYGPGEKGGPGELGATREPDQCLTSTLTSGSPCSRCQSVFSTPFSSRGSWGCTFKSMPAQILGILDPGGREG